MDKHENKYFVKEKIFSTTILPWDIVESKNEKPIVKINEDDNKYYLKALLVRILKKERELKNNDLIDIFKNLSKYNYSENKITKMIDNLIDDDYFERKDDKIIYVP